MIGKALYLAVAAIALGACAGSTPIPVPAPITTSPGPREVDALPSKAPDRVVRYAAHARGFVELRLPKGRGPFPVAVLFHGGCWTKGFATQQNMAALASRLTEFGIATINVDYREVGDGGGWTGSFSDWDAAGGAVERIARDFPLDLGRVTLIGHSAGGTPALWLAAPQDQAGPIGARQPFRARAAILLDAAVDLAPLSAIDRAICGAPVVSNFMGGTPAQVPDRYRAVSPVQNPPQVKRMLLVYAELPRPGTEVLAAIRARGIRVDEIAGSGAGHFDAIAPGTKFYAEIEPRLIEVIRER